MALPAFDTLRIANRLKAVGVPSAQAEAEAEALSEVFEVNLKELATKEDLRATKEDLRREIGDLRKDIDTKLANMKFDLLRWFFGIALAQTGLLVALKLWL